MQKFLFKIWTWILESIFFDDKQYATYSAIYIYKGQLKSSLADQDTLMECVQMKFILQHSLSCSQ